MSFIITIRSGYQNGKVEKKIKPGKITRRYILALKGEGKKNTFLSYIV